MSKTFFVLFHCNKTSATQKLWVISLVLDPEAKLSLEIMNSTLFTISCQWRVNISKCCPRMSLVASWPTGLWLLLPAGCLAIPGPLDPIILKSKPLVSNSVPAFGSRLLALPLTSGERIGWRAWPNLEAPVLVLYSTQSQEFQRPVGGPYSNERAPFLLPLEPRIGVLL